MNNLLVLAVIGLFGLIIADAALKTALALPRIVAQAEARRAQ